MSPFSRGSVRRDAGSADCDAVGGGDKDLQVDQADVEGIEKDPVTSSFILGRHASDDDRKRHEQRSQ